MILIKEKILLQNFHQVGEVIHLNDSEYTEHLEYCNDRQWEGNDFSFTITINNDTLIQQGIEKIDSIGVNRMNIEKYVRLKGSEITFPLHSHCHNFNRDSFGDCLVNYTISFCKLHQCLHLFIRGI